MSNLNRLILDDFGTVNVELPTDERVDMNPSDTVDLFSTDIFGVEETLDYAIVGTDMIKLDLNTVQDSKTLDSIYFAERFDKEPSHILDLTMIIMIIMIIKISSIE